MSESGTAAPGLLLQMLVSHRFWKTLGMDEAVTEAIRPAAVMRSDFEAIGEWMDD